MRTRGGAKSMSARPGIDSASTRLRLCPAGLPPSVTRTDPHCAGFSARPTSWLSSRLETGVMGMATSSGCRYVTGDAEGTQEHMRVAGTVKATELGYPDVETRTPLDAPGVLGHLLHLLWFARLRRDTVR